MITHLQGILIEKTPTFVVIECQGVGYMVHISLSTFEKIQQQEGQSIRLFTFLQIKEDAHTLFGFCERFEREIFLLLVSVSGIGANTARIMLSSLSPEMLQNAITAGDARTIQSAKGIGAKTAARVILELREKMLKLQASTDQQTPQTPTHNQRNEAIAALEVLGYAPKVAQGVVEKIIQQSPTPLSVENIIKQALLLL